MRDRLMELLKFAKSINSERVELQKDEYIYLLEFMENAIVTPVKVGQKMENLNAEQVKKALECCTLEGCHDCRECPQGNVLLSLCKKNAMADALALINSQEQRIGELTEEKKKLGKAFDDLLKEAETYLKQRDALQNRVKYLEKNNNERQTNA